MRQSLILAQANVTLTNSLAKVGLESLQSSYPSLSSDYSKSLSIMWGSMIFNICITWLKKKLVLLSRWSSNKHNSQWFRCTFLLCKCQEPILCKRFPFLPFFVPPKIIFSVFLLLLRLLMMNLLILSAQVNLNWSFLYCSLKINLWLISINALSDFLVKTQLPLYL